MSEVCSLRAAKDASISSQELRQALDNIIVLQPLQNVFLGGNRGPQQGDIGEYGFGLFGVYLSGGAHGDCALAHKEISAGRRREPRSVLTQVYIGARF